MNISNLPNGLKELAKKRRKEDEYGEFFKSDEDRVYAFAWDKTKEDYNFWNRVNGGDFSVYDDLYPTHQWIDDYPGEYQVIADANIVTYADGYIAYDEGIKEEGGKISYELDWEFIEAMAARMSKNKGKYPPYNWHKPIEVEKLKQSLVRHVVEIMKGNYEDDGDEFGHLAAVALNIMMLNYQLKKYGV